MSGLKQTTMTQAFGKRADAADPSTDSDEELERRLELYRIASPLYLEEILESQVEMITRLESAAKRLSDASEGVVKQSDTLVYAFNGMSDWCLRMKDPSLRAEHLSKKRKLEEVRRVINDVHVTQESDDESYKPEASESESPLSPKPLKKQKCNFPSCHNMYDPNEVTSKDNVVDWMDCQQCDGKFTCCSAHGRREMKQFVAVHERGCRGV